MNKKSKNITTVITCIVCVLAAATKASIHEDNAVKPLLSSLRNHELKEMSKKQFASLLGKDVNKAKSAADFFADLSAYEVLIEGLENQDYEVKTHIAELMTEWVKKGDANTLRILSTELSGTLDLIDGGELSFLRSNYRMSLLKNINIVMDSNITCTNSMSRKKIKQILERSESWLQDSKKGSPIIGSGQTPRSIISEGNRPKAGSNNLP